ncbi:MAG: hypothetical protein M9901_13675 [Lentimicrobium sp.]|nr:hypothetical protein [Lentimicrobium sp.]
MRGLFFMIPAIILLSACGNLPEVNQPEEPQIVEIITDLENPDSLLTAQPLAWKNGSTIREGMAYSGKFASHLDAENEYSFVFEQKLGYVSNLLPARLTYEARVYSEKPAPGGYMVVSIDDKGYYQSYPIADFFARGGDWKKVSSTYELPDSLEPSDLIKVYIWNNRESELLVDDISLQFELIPEKER